MRLLSAQRDLICKTFLDDLASSDISNNPPDDPNTQLDLYNTALQVIYEKHVNQERKLSSPAA